MEGAKVTALQNSLLTKLDKVESDIPDWVPRYQQQFQKETKKAQAETRAEAHNPIQVTATKVIDHTGCFFLRKSSKYGICPSQQDKIAKYTGPPQSYQMSELLTNNFCCQKNYCFV